MPQRCLAPHCAACSWSPSHNQPHPSLVMPAKSPPGIQSVEVGGRLLRALIGSAGAMNLTPLAKAAKMPATKARRYLMSFIRLGLVAQAPHTRQYNLGPLHLSIQLTPIA